MIGRRATGAGAKEERPSSRGPLFRLLAALLVLALAPAACSGRERAEAWDRETRAFTETMARIHTQLLSVLVRQMPPQLAPWVDTEILTGAGSIQDVHESSERSIDGYERQIRALDREIEAMESAIEKSRKEPSPFENANEMFTRSWELYYELKRVEFLKWRRE
jgi:hypothetical protein